MVSVRFASGHFYDTEREAVLFTAFHDRRMIPCAIPISTLREQFDSDSSSVAALFERQRYLIERLVEELILEGRFEADGSILICAPDCRWLRDGRHLTIKQALATGEECLPAVPYES